MRGRLLRFGIDSETFAISPAGKQKIEALLARGDLSELPFYGHDLEPLAVAARHNEWLRRKVTPIAVERYLAGRPLRPNEAWTQDDSLMLVRYLGRLHPDSLDDWVSAWAVGKPKYDMLLSRAGPEAARRVAKFTSGKDPLLAERAAKFLLADGMLAAAAPKELFAASSLAGQEQRFRAYDAALRVCAPVLTPLIAEEYFSATVTAQRQVELVGYLDMSYFSPEDPHARKVLDAALGDARPEVAGQAAAMMSRFPLPATVDDFGVARLLKHVADSPPQIRFAAAYVLAKRGVQKKELAVILATTLMTGVAYKSDEGLRTLGPLAAPALPELRKRLREPQRWHGEFATLQALGPAAAQAAPELKAIMDRNEVHASSAAAMTLWTATRDDRAILYLCDILRRTPQPGSAG